VLEKHVQEFLWICVERRELPTAIYTISSVTTDVELEF